MSTQVSIDVDCPNCQRQLTIHLDRPAQVKVAAVSYRHDTTHTGHDQFNPSRFARVLIRERTKQSMGRMVLHQRSGVTYPYLSEIELGHKYPKEETITKLANALGLNTDQLLGLVAAEDDAES